MALTLDGNLKFTKTLKVKASGCVVLQIINKDTGLVVMSPVTVDWEDVNGNIVIKQITGLEPDTNYTIRLLVV